MTPLEALQSTLAAEHAAVYVYGVLGARTSLAADPATWQAMADGLARHRARRDDLEARVRDAGAEPVASAVAYEVAGPVRTAAQREDRARGLEERLAATYAAMVGGTARGDRRFALDALLDAATRVLELGGRPETFPGAADLA